MGAVCCSDTREFGSAESRAAVLYKPLMIRATDEKPVQFGQQVLTHYFKLNPKVLESLKKFDLYRFEDSTADLLGTEHLPVQLASSDNFLFVGQFLGRKMHGKGHMLTKEGDFFICPFVDGLPKGEGAVYFANGDYFKGRIAGDIVEGKMIYENGTAYLGRFLNRKKHGQGVFTFEDGTRYDGNWVNDAEHGAGKLIITGVWKNGTKLSPIEAQGLALTPQSTSAIASPGFENKFGKMIDLAPAEIHRNVQMSKFIEQNENNSRI